MCMCTCGTSSEVGVWEEGGVVCVCVWGGGGGGEG